MKPASPILAVLLLPFPLLAQQELAQPVFVDGQAQVVPEYENPDEWIQHDLWVETEFDTDGDGKPDRMHVDVTRPWQTEDGLRVPVIYETSPYYCGTGTTESTYFWDPHQEVGGLPHERNPMPAVRQRVSRPIINPSQIRDWVPRGFAVVHSSSPGTGYSQGCPTAGGENESLAPKAVIDWLNGRAKGYTTPDGDEEVEAFWSTGKVGMTGTSYEGTLPVAAATTGVEGLEAIIPIAANTSYYLYYRSNGLVRHPGGYMGEDIDVIYDFINSGDPERREYCNCEVRDNVLAAEADRVTGDYNDFWASRNYLAKLDQWHAATLVAHAWNDWNVMPEHNVKLYEALKAKGVPTQLYMHQGGHGGPPPFEMMNRWFSRYLYGIENGVEEDPRSWIVREHERQPTPYADYPNPAAELVALYPSEGGNGTGGLFSDPTPDQGTETVVDDVSFSGEDLARADSSEHRLLYVSPVLQEPLHFSGTGRIDVKLASSAPAANLSVWVVSLPWKEGGQPNDNIITRGWADPQNATSNEESEPLEPGEFVTLSFELQPDDQVIPAGQHLGLMIFSSDRDFTLWPPAGTELEFDLGGTRLSLPVVGGAEALARSFGE